MSTLKEENIASYLSFKISDELFAAHVSKVLSIIEQSKMTKLPNTPPYVLGVINLRGTVLPIIDTHLKLGIPKSEEKGTPIIIVMEFEQAERKITLGALVDGVREVMDIDQNKIIPPPEIGGKFKSEFISGMIEEGDHFIMVLDVESIFTTDKILSIFSDEQSSELSDSVEETEPQTNANEIAETWLQEALASSVDDGENKEAEEEKDEEQNDETHSIIIENEESTTSDENIPVDNEIEKTTEEQGEITDKNKRTHNNEEDIKKETELNEKPNANNIEKKQTTKTSKEEIQELNEPEENEEGENKSAADILLKKIGNKKEKEQENKKPEQ